MSSTALESRETLAEALIERMRARSDPAEQPVIEAFLRLYYARVPLEELAEYRLPDLYGAAMSHFNLARRRARGQDRLRVYNPRFEEDGWESTHTVIELVVADRPFLVDSVRLLLTRHELGLHRMIRFVARVRRDADGVLGAVEPDSRDDGAGAADGGALESVLHAEIDRQPEPEDLARVRDGVLEVLADVGCAVDDWPLMRSALINAAQALDAVRDEDRRAELDELRAFVDWLDSEHFVFLGYRELVATAPAEVSAARGSVRQSLGIFRAPQRVGQPVAEPDWQVDDALLRLTKASLRATVHRPSYMDCVVLKRVDDAGRVVGAHVFYGLYTWEAYNRDPREIPILRQKVQAVLDWVGMAPDRHDAKRLINTLETFPREELFEIDRATLHRQATGILRLEERQRLALFLRAEAFGRYLTAMVFLPRERYTTSVRERIEAVLVEALGGMSAEFTIRLSESVLARIVFMIHRAAPGTGGEGSDSSPEVDVTRLEARLREVVRSWDDEFANALLEHCGEVRGNRLLKRYRRAFSAAYREDFLPRTAVRDIERLEGLDVGGIDMRLYRPLEAPEGLLRLTLFTWDRPLSLSSTLPLLENMGVQVIQERPYRVLPDRDRPPTIAATRPATSPADIAEREPADGSRTRGWIHDFSLQHGEVGELEADAVRTIFQATLTKAFAGQVDNDGFNRLTLAARLDWRQVVLLRAYAAYLRQGVLGFSQRYIEDALVGHSSIARRLVKLFELRFDPDRQAGSEQRQVRLSAALGEALDGVESIDADRILRGVFHVIQATLRTNFYAEGAAGGLAFKLEPARIPDLPAPRPAFEIFVYSPRYEGVHLRAGRVARGGLRWSDRLEDYRTEILGLMKAQVVKNAVIVPQGAKGGFVVKRSPQGADREARQAEAIACYRAFINALLALTDNLVEGQVVPPERVVRADGDDPYLVVAADKGTATFSDIANEVAEARGFWLGDAFASGGRTGYDHKRMGITARGAWVCVQRHFADAEIDLDRPFTVVGIGDMSGDVFGNGMLLSDRIRLIAAFDHRHIFIDPDPDPAASYAERKRLFALERSSWADYDPSLISPGGGVFRRDAKQIRLSAHIRERLDLRAESVSPARLASAILKAPVDLLWNGGIGTFVKASDERDADVGDRANDSVRVNGGELGARVVGEGGNLGLTQRGRIEFALAGGRINTDFIDNAAGVSCSDLEVNIKVVLDAVMADGQLTWRQRNELLLAMTDQVAELALAQNYWQALALSRMVESPARGLDEIGRFMRFLERQASLDRALWALPDDEALAARTAAGGALTRPEAAVLLAYGKNWLYQSLLQSTLPDGADYGELLDGYFPDPLHTRFAAYLDRHRLRRDIIATRLVNQVVNRMGPTFVYRVMEDAEATVEAVVYGFTAAWAVFDLQGLWRALARLDARVPWPVQRAMMDEVTGLAERVVMWLIRHGVASLGLSRLCERFTPGLKALARLRDSEPSLMPAREQADAWREAGVDIDLAERVSGLSALYVGLDIVDGAMRSGCDLGGVAQVYFALGTRLELGTLREACERLTGTDRWQVRAAQEMVDTLFDLQRELTVEALQLEARALPSSGSEYPGEPVDPGAGTPRAQERLAAWLRAKHGRIEGVDRLLGEFRASSNPDLAMLTVVVAALQRLR